MQSARHGSGQPAARQPRARISARERDNHQKNTGPRCPKTGTLISERWVFNAGQIEMRITCLKNNKNKPRRRLQTLMRSVMTGAVPTI